MNLWSEQMARFLDALEVLYTPVPLEQFPRHFFAVVGMLVPDVVMSYDDHDFKTGKQIDCLNVEVADLEAWRQTCAVNLPRDHPAFAYLQSGGAERFFRLNDFLTQRQVRQTGLYWDNFRPVGMEYQLSVMMEMPGHGVGFSVNRKKDFSEGEIELVRRLTPHAVRAHMNAQLFTALQAAAERTPDFSPHALLRAGITPREAEVLKWVAEGKTNPEIGIILGVSARTVGKHVENLLAKLGVETRTAAAIRAQEILRGA